MPLPNGGAYAPAQQGQYPALISSSGALNPGLQQDYVITKAGVAALTLAAPVAGQDDGVEIYLYSNTAFSHTLTATGLLQTGSNAVNVATFNPFAGASLGLQAYNGKFMVTSANGVSFS